MFLSVTDSEISQVRGCWVGVGGCFWVLGVFLSVVDVLSVDRCCKCFKCFWCFRDVDGCFCMLGVFLSVGGVFVC